MKPRSERITILVPLDVDNQLRFMAAKKRISRLEIVREAIDEYLVKHGRVIPGPDGLSGVPIKVDPSLPDGTAVITDYRGHSTAVTNIGKDEAKDGGNSEWEKAMANGSASWYQPNDGNGKDEKK